METLTIKEPKILHLTLKKGWFYMIASGEKKEEYREIKPYWIKRLISDDFNWDCETSQKRNIHFSACKSGFYKKYDVIIFRNGYAKDAPSIIVEFEGIKRGNGYCKWGAEKGFDYFVIKLGKVLNTIKETAK